MGESGKINAATEGATAPETLRSMDHLKDKMLESGLYWCKAPPTE